MGNPLCHFELMTNDTDKAKAFYGAVFDWKFDDQTMPGYTLIETGQDPSGGVFPKPDEAPHPCLNVYFTVSDIDATLAKVSEHGGKTLVPKTAIPNVGNFAMFIDPEEIVVGLLQPNKR